MIRPDHEIFWIGSAVLGGLSLATIIGFALGRTAKTDSAKRTIINLNARTRSWWMMIAILTLSLWLGRGATCTLFGLISFAALREMLTLAPTRRSDHHTLFWAFFVITPLQFYLTYIGWYGFFAVFIPVYAFLFLAIRSTLLGDHVNYMERVGKVMWGLMICVYCLSHIPGLLMLETEGRGIAHPWRLIVFLVIVVQISDVLQYVLGKLLGRHKIAPHLSPNKTWEGFIGGVLTATLVGMLLRNLTPFDLAQSIEISLTVTILGFFGGVVMSAIKRDAGIKDFGALIAGHGGMLDRVDSLSFAAPVFFHVIRWWFT